MGYNEETYKLNVVGPLSNLVVDFEDVFDTPEDEDDLGTFEFLVWRWTKAREDLESVMEDAQALFGIPKEGWQY